MEDINNSLPWVIFELRHQLYAISTRMVNGIVKMPPITVVPNAPPMFIGVARLRGTVIPVLDLKRLFNVSDGKEEAEKAIKLLNIKKEAGDVYIKEIRRCVESKEEFCLTEKNFFGGGFNKEIMNGKTDVTRLATEVMQLEEELISLTGSAGADYEKLTAAERCGRKYIRAVSSALEKIAESSSQMVITLTGEPGASEAILGFTVDGIRAVDELEMIENRGSSTCLYMSAQISGVAHNERIKGEILIADDREIVKMIRIYNESVKNKEE